MEIHDLIQQARTDPPHDAVADIFKVLEAMTESIEVLRNRLAKLELGPLHAEGGES